MGKTKGIMISIILVIITVVIILQLIGGTASTMVNSSNSVLYSCDGFQDSTGVDYYLNLTDFVCYNSSNVDPQSSATDRLPLATLFASGGIVWLIFMAMILVLVVGIVLFIKSRKN